MLYLQTILQRNDSEITKQIYKAQSLKTSPGDFVEMVRKDFESIEENFDEAKIASLSKESYKTIIKKKIKVAAFKYLKEIQKKH